MSGIGTVVSASAVPVTLAAETVVLTIPFSGGCAANASLLNGPNAGKPTKNRIAGTMNMLAGAGTTAVVLRCRQGGLAGTAVGAETNTLAAGNTETVSFDFPDAAANFAQAYVITAQQTGGTANGTVNFIDGVVTDFN